MTVVPIHPRCERLATSTVVFCLTGVLMLAWGCRHDPQANTRSSNGVASTDPATPLESESIPNLYRVTPTLYSGGQPHNDAAFTHLQSLGVKTIISVDGITPDVATAKRFGMRYVHLPVGYDGIKRRDALVIAKAADTLDQPVFIHCHHGQHRGPTAAALAVMIADGWSNEQAVAWMEQAGTSLHYEGLYRSVETFAPPSRQVFKNVLSSFPEKAALEPFTESMARIGQLFTHLKQFKANGYEPIKQHPDLSPAHEALLLNEAFREAQRSDQTKGPFADDIAASVAATQKLHDALVQWQTTGDPQHARTADQLMVTISQSCKQCHRRDRD